jgi:hypothetical protein
MGWGEETTCRLITNLRNIKPSQDLEDTHFNSVFLQYRSTGSCRKWQFAQQIQQSQAGRLPGEC